MLAAIIGLSMWADIPNGYYTNAIGKQASSTPTANWATTSCGIVTPIPTRVTTDITSTCIPQANTITIQLILAALPMWDRASTVSTRSPRVGLAAKSTQCIPT